MWAARRPATTARLADQFGLQIGAQTKAIIFLFMTQDALDRFCNGDGWAVGGDVDSVKQDVRFTDNHLGRSAEGIVAG
jgi:lipid-binding SYLF domain-containing protein